MVPPQCYWGELWGELCLCISRGAACPVTVLTSFSPPQSLGGRTLLGPGAVWAPVPVNGVAPEQRQPATQRSAPEFL